MKYKKQGENRWIDECYGGMTDEQFQGAMMFAIGECFERIKIGCDSDVEEIKIAEYAKYWREHEHEQIGGDLAFVDRYIAKLENGE